MRWREAETGTYTSYTAYDREQAEFVCRILNANGQSFSALNRVLEEQAAVGPTVHQVLTEHIDLLVKPTPQTIHNYRKMVELHLVDLHALPLTSLDSRHISLWIRDMQAQGKSAKTMRNVHGLLSSAMETAVRFHYRDDNPCRAIELPSNESAGDDRVFLTTEEYRLLRDCLPDRAQPLADFLVYTGARFGEATAVTVRDLFLDDAPAPVRINKSWKRDGSSGHYVGAPKTTTSKRTVSMPSRLVDVVHPVVAGSRPGDLVFEAVRGGRLAHTLFWRNAWVPAVKDAQRLGLDKDPTIHSLRHTSASWLIALGVPLFELSRRLGHASIGGTDRVYGHLMPGAHKQAARVLDSL
ncbi:site-specific integrase [Arthrobacter sp. I2-34]|uniref:Site-specific integrase n=1 Tax=Arthrobacter hankyongi TaxID=2904801 RepID=A0ABS9L8S9_9MICC|nr:site-specific integrase [Arthrobacter hankyongi]MCG2623087.1 site-specific integrase [Arthrobacter hankyongi]